MSDVEDAASRGEGKGEHVGWFGVPPRPVTNPEKMAEILALDPYAEMDPAEVIDRMKQGLIDPEKDVADMLERRKTSDS
ncbi:MAG: hypothetical protein M3O70_05690 [Actinomycetota bacterium]|nr:hypothetical protein [Actinomycetota bacterium]